ncbi:hypothetical protein HII36_53230 [Nonomuraea sp. NN258]|uniref:hypothetical protein n=1 Tax=Nonomuraea antri TaxID=2730852 RepID=UPI001569A2F1|nr:hypothetical protein [Nonomuraea antri]NRQ40524.1 hypothetical protein [Nonomuraea antri]
MRGQGGGRCRVVRRGEYRYAPARRRSPYQRDVREPDRFHHDQAGADRWQRAHCVEGHLGRYRRAQAAVHRDPAGRPAQVCGRVPVPEQVRDRPSAAG